MIGDQPRLLMLLVKRVFFLRSRSLKSLRRWVESWKGLDTHSEKLDRMEQAGGQLTEKVDGISQDFRIIKHFWWICLVAAGALLKAGYDAFIKPVVG